jgi:hypothetical protein
VDESAFILQRNDWHGLKRLKNGGISFSASVVTFRLPQRAPSLCAALQTLSSSLGISRLELVDNA